MKTRKEELEKISALTVTIRTNRESEEMLIEDIRAEVGEEFAISEESVEKVIELSLILDEFGTKYVDILDRLEEAVIYAIEDGKKELDDISILKTFREQIYEFKEIKEKKPKDLERTAIHEIGHCLVNEEVKSNKLYLITIIPFGNNRGQNLQMQNKFKGILNEEEMINEIAATLAGEVAEEMKYGTKSTLEVDDIKKVTDYAYYMVLVLAMGRGPSSILGRNIVFIDKDGNLDFSKLTPNQFEEATANADKIIQKAKDKAREILEQKEEQIEILLEALLERGALNRKQVELLINKDIELSDLPPAKIDQI